MPKPVGERGSWFATWNGEKLPCVHRCFTKGIWPHHCDPLMDDSAKCAPWVDALREGGKAILTDDELDKNGNPVNRTGYVALYRIDNVELKGNELHFDFKERLADFR